MAGYGMLATVVLIGRQLVHLSSTMDQPPLLRTTSASMIRASTTPVARTTDGLATPSADYNIVTTLSILRAQRVNRWRKRSFWSGWLQRTLLGKSHIIHTRWWRGLSKCLLSQLQSIKQSSVRRPKLPLE